MKLETIVSPNFPRGQVPTNTRGLFMSRMIAALRVGVERVVDDIIYSTSSRNTASGYSWDTTLAGDAVQARVFNSWEYWPFWEDNSNAHWPPHKVGTRLYDWSSEHGIGHYWMAMQIYDRGTPGHFVFTRHWRAGEPYIQSLLQVALAQFVHEALGFE